MCNAVYICKNLPLHEARINHVFDLDDCMVRFMKGIAVCPECWGPMEVGECEGCQGRATRVQVENNNTRIPVCPTWPYCCQKDRPSQPAPKSNKVRSIEDAK
jgi:hypothetical protein